MPTVGIGELVRQFYDVLWNAWDDDAVEAVLAPTFAFRGSLGVETRGWEGWRAYRDRVRTGVPDFHNQVTGMLCESDRAAVRLECSGHHRGPLLGIEATGRSFRYSAAAFLEAERGRLTSAWVLGDLDGLRRQLTGPDSPMTDMPSDPTTLYRLRDGIYAADLLLAAVVDLDLFSWLAARSSVTPAEIIAEFGLASRPVDVMLSYLVALGLVVRHDEHIVLANLGRDHFVDGSPFDLRPYYSSLRERPGVSDMRTVLATGESAAWASAAQGGDWASRLADPAFAAAITAAMDARGRYLGPHLAAALDDLPVQRVLDVGGSSGVYLSALIDRRPGVRGTILERPPVDLAARTLVSDRGYSDRINVRTADMFGDPWPGGHDLHLFSHVLHDWDEKSVRSLLAASFGALMPGGWIVDHDVHLNPYKTGPLPAAEYSVFLMHATPGKCWSVKELSGMLTDCGFQEVRSRETAADRSVVIARKPAL